MMPKQDSGTCQRFLSGTAPCPNMDDEDLSTLRAWSSQAIKHGTAYGEVTMRADKICAECEDYLPLPEGQV